MTDNQSSDIVERLRRYSEDVMPMPHYPNDICSEAADEIERLRNALQEIDTIAVSKKAGAARMQRIARDALAPAERGGTET